MKVRTFAIVGTLMVAGCDPGGRDPASKNVHAFKRWDDKFVAYTGVPLPWRPWVCATSHYVIVPTDQCVKMNPPRRWRGLWVRDFELSRFCPEPAAKCDYYSPGDQIWLTDRSSQRVDWGLYKVDFIGRRTIFGGGYGHMGVFEHEMIVDRIISVKRFDPVEIRDQDRAEASRMSS